MSCPRCHEETSLPYMCRLCWRAIGHGGQLAFYRRLGNMRKEHKSAG